MDRYNPKFDEGLNEKQIQNRINENLVNFDTTVKTKSVKSIVFSNVFTLFNLINVLLALAIAYTGSYRNLLFMIIIISNTLISIIQEIRSKKTIDKLSIQSQSNVYVIRNKKKKEISINEILLDDILEFNSGDKIPTDCIIQEGEADFNESFITGEEDQVRKSKGDLILSGSYVVSGKCYGKVEHIGLDNYVAKISNEAKKRKKNNSEIMNSLNKIIKIVSIAIVPVGILLFFNQVGIPDITNKQAIVNTVAALIGMIPEGLVLLTSVALAASVVRLAKKKILVQELYSIESLARVDTLCLDKTGTITKGDMEVKKTISFVDGNEIEDALAYIGRYSEDKNASIEAIRKKYKTKKEKTLKTKVPFNSVKKWSAIEFEDVTYMMGAPEFILLNKKDIYEKYKDKIDEYTETYRVLLVAKSSLGFIPRDDKQYEIPEDIEALGLVLIHDNIRKNAKETLKYFKKQGVNIKIISGDNPKTISRVAKDAGLEDYQNYIDVSSIEKEADIKNIAENYTIFGRVTPEKKKMLISSLKENGHTVAMIGDGVNDVMALKQSDCSIAIASGTEAARNVSKLVLLDSDFGSMPAVVAEGRRTINNIERSASLFLVKTIYSAILSILFVLINTAYPFMPIQLSLISLVTIGIPSVILALEPNTEKIKGDFLKNIIVKALPTALTIVLNIVLMVIFKNRLNLSNTIYSSMCMILTAISGFVLIFRICRPFNIPRTILFISIVMIFILAITIFKDIFSIQITFENIKTIMPIAFLSIINIGVLTAVSEKMQKKIFKKAK